VPKLEAIPGCRIRGGRNAAALSVQGADISMLNFYIIFRVISRTIFIISVALITCTGIALLYREDIQPFLLSSAVSLLLGTILHLLTHVVGKKNPIQRTDAALIVTLSWLITSLVGSLPYILSGSIPTFTNALFESVSGFTTTGASILTDIEVLPRSVLFWRSLTHWIGGIGIIVLVIVVMPTLQIGEYHLFIRESSLQEKIKPKIKSVGSHLLMIYITLTLVEIMLLLAGRMDLFDSVCHAFGTLSTGGFSPKNTSIAGYSRYIQYVIMVFMLFGGTNYALFYYLIKGNFRQIKLNEELKLYLLMVAVIGSIITATLFVSMHKPLEESFRVAFFQVISIVTCTGFATADYLLWPECTVALIVFSMFLGGSAGSTAGGIKMARHLVMLKNIAGHLRELLSKNVVVSITLSGNHISDDSSRSILTYIVVYILVFMAGSIMLMITGIDGGTAGSSVATCMANIGPGIGTVGPASNYAHLPDAGKVILTVLMLAGRLEIYTLILLLSRHFWTPL
jgi:trk system potassium uptake protein